MGEAVEVSTGGKRAPQHPFAALAYRDFRLYWCGQFFTLTGTAMQQVAVAWQIYLLTHSAIALGVIGICRIVPIILLSLTAGVVADVLDRRKLLLLLQPVLLLGSAILAVTTVTGKISIWILYSVIAVGAAAFSFVSPAQQALVPSLVPRDRLPNALSLSTTSWQVATVVGPSLAGVVIAVFGVATIYVIDVLSFVAPIVALSLIHPPPIVGAIQRVSIRAAIEGLQFVRRSPIILYTMGLDFVATFFGSATALLPIFARDVLRVGSQGYGVLYAAPSLGAVAAGIVMSLVGARIERKGAMILMAVAAYAACTVIFGLSHIFLLSLLALAGTGASDTVSMILRQTVRQIVTPDALRGRMGSVTMIFFVGGPQLGEFEAGVVARSLGAPFSVISGGLAALLATAIIAYLGVGLRQYRD